MTANSKQLLPSRHLAMAALVVGAWGAAFCPAASAQEQWFMHTGGVSHHFQQTSAPGRQWNQNHPGIGFERRQTPEGGWDVRYTGGVMEDSRNIWSGYAGAAYMRDWKLGAGVSFGLGAGAYAFYRSMSWDGRRGLVPGVLPTASLGLLDNQVALNLLYVPRMAVYGRSMPEVVYLQLAVRMR